MLNPTPEYIEAIYAPARQLKARMYFTINGEEKMYDNNTIISVNILEEMNALNNTLPSNEIKITLDNTTGEFNILNLSNMHEIIASKPKIVTELGLVYPIPVMSSLVNSNFENFPLTTIATDWTLYGTGVTLSKDTGFTGNGQKISVVSGSNGGINSGYDVKAVPVGAQIYVRFLYKGTKPNYNYIMTASGNKILPPLTVTSIDGTWFEAKAEVTQTWANPLDLGIIICLDQRAAGVAGTTTIDDVYVSTSPYGSEVEYIEWVPMGTHYLIEWKNEIAARTITLYGRDNFEMLSEISYDDLTTKTLYDLAVDVLTKANITNFIIDESLREISGRFFNRINSREALQYIGIASMSAVYQDRPGRIIIKPLLALDKSSNYLTYSGQSGLYAGTTLPMAYPYVTTGAGMKYIDFDQMYDVPEISLDKSIYEVIVVAYIDPLDQGITAEVSYKSTIGNNGESFKIDNPLITSEAQALEVAEWFWRESRYNAIYKANWRQNPILECGDVILMEDSFDAKKQTRIYKQEFNYTGYLEGNTESRGGI